MHQSPSGLLTSVAQGSRGLLNSTVYAISSATSQFSKAAHKVLHVIIVDRQYRIIILLKIFHFFLVQGIVAFTFDQLGASELEEQQNHLEHGKGVLNEFLEVKFITEN